MGSDGAVAGGAVYGVAGVDRNLPEPLTWCGSKLDYKANRSLLLVYCLYALLYDCFSTCHTLYILTASACSTR